MYLNKSAVKTLCKEYNRQASAEFMVALDKYVEQTVINACRLWNGKHARLVPEMLGLTKKVK